MTIVQRVPCQSRAVFAIGSSLGQRPTNSPDRARRALLPSCSFATTSRVTGSTKRIGPQIDRPNNAPLSAEHASSNSARYSCARSRSIVTGSGSGFLAVASARSATGADAVVGARERSHPLADVASVDAMTIGRSPIAATQSNDGCVPAPSLPPSATKSHSTSSARGAKRFGDHTTRPAPRA